MLSRQGLWWWIGCLWWIVRAAAPAWSVQANAHGWCKECAGTCIREPARMGMTPDRAYDASASGDDRQPEMMLRTAVRKGDASEVLTVVVRILSRESCSVRSMYLDKSSYHHVHTIGLFSAHTIDTAVRSYMYRYYSHTPPLTPKRIPFWTGFAAVTSPARRDPAVSSLWVRAL